MFCVDCITEHPARLKETKDEYLRLKMILMYDRALRILERQHVQMHLYQESAEVVKAKSEQPQVMFNSAHEMVAVMELIRNKIKTQIQFNIGRFRVDILLPKEKAIVEVDGVLHKHQKEKDYHRDIEIRKKLGADWEIVRIPTSKIEQNISQLLTAVREIRAYKQDIRNNNNGLIPSWYSKREATAWEKITKEHL
jgi:very-short-patch-repair endonuclease